MSRELRRVPLDFDWPLNKVWDGYIMPADQVLPACPDCVYDDSPTGYTPEAYAIEHTFYPHQTGSKLSAWSDKIGQLEVDNLLAENRLRTWVDGRWESLPLTAAEVNARQRAGGLGGHDAINRSILVSFRCRQLGITELCPTCNGHCDIGTPEQRDSGSVDNWTATEPPEGPGWQAWETVTEGSPCSPVFETSTELVDWAVSPYGTLGIGGTPVSREAAEAFVRVGSSSTMVGSFGRGVVGGVEALGQEAKT